LAVAYAGARQPVLMITHGYSGSGKTSLTQGLLEVSGAIRIRADVERKRLSGLSALDRSPSPVNAGLYSASQTDATYAGLLDAATAMLEGGWHVILDASFLSHIHRVAARKIALDCHARFVILDFDAAPDVLRQRLRQRSLLGEDASDADENVLALQMQTADPLQADEASWVMRVQTLPLREASEAGTAAAARGDWAPLLALLAIDDA
jgi:uncharacterized protein